MIAQQLVIMSLGISSLFVVDREKALYKLLKNIRKGEYKKMTIIKGPNSATGSTSVSPKKEHILRIGAEKNIQPRTSVSPKESVRDRSIYLARKRLNYALTRALNRGRVFESAMRKLYLADGAVELNRNEAKALADYINPGNRIKLILLSNDQKPFESAMDKIVFVTTTTDDRVELTEKEVDALVERLDYIREKRRPNGQIK